CNLAQPDFATQLSNNNVIFRIPTPTFGAGLIEAIPDAAIVANQASNLAQKEALGIAGRPNFALAGRTITGMTNNNGNDGTIWRGRQTFGEIGCALCHTLSFTTGNSPIAALRNKPVNLFSDLLVHDMGVGLADGITQGEAGPREFRTAPLWGLGQRVFFLHDG